MRHGWPLGGKVAIWSVALGCTLTVGLSRVYLGVHYPTDLFGGYVIGGFFLLGGIWFLKPIEAWLGKKGLWWQIGLTVLVTVLLLVFLPTHDDNGITEAALLCSSGIGLALERRFVRFSSRGTPSGLILRLLLGLVVLLGLRFYLSAAFSPLGSEMTFRFIRYMTVGLWFVAGAPWVFVKFKLAECE